MKKVTVSAPGKLHISGEHAVVYGKPSLIVATSLRLYVTLEKGIAPPLSDIRKKDSYIDAICTVFEKKYATTPEEGIGIAITSTVPVRSGMGSSAALAVALVGALSAWHGVAWNVQAINESAYQAEKAKHETSSGSDPAVAAHGGLLWYRKELEFLKTLWLLPFKIPKVFAPFVLINTGRNENTGDLVRHVAGIKAGGEQYFAGILNDVERVTKEMTEAIHDENEVLFRQTLTKNEKLLEDMGIVSPDAKELIRKIEKSGGAAKISGAGGIAGGSGIILAVHNKPETLMRIAKKHNYPSFQVALGGAGVRLEQVLI